MTIKKLFKMTDYELLHRADEERISIFKKYDLGRKIGAQIDIWEESEYTVIQKTDKFGFIHDNENDNKFLHISPEREKFLIRIQQEREKKWKKMLGGDNFKLNHEKLRRRIYKGIPNTYRASAWIKLLNLDKIKDENKGVYEKFLNLAREWATEAKQIDSDVNRQFRDHIDFHARYSLKQISLFKVLVAYSMYNMEVGYCQGMAGLGGILLMYMDEEDAFWALNELLTNKKYGMHGFFILGFPKLIRFTKHHDTVVTKFMPSLKKHLDANGLDSILYTLKWFFVVFVERIPFDLCLRIWDIYFLDGERVLVGMAYTILKLHKNKILKLKEMDAITTFLQTTLYNDFGYDNDFVIKKLEQSLEELRRYKLDLPPPPENDELLNIKNVLGKFIEPNTDKKIGLRPIIFNEIEKNVTHGVLERREILENTYNVTDNNSICDNGEDSASITVLGDTSSFIGSLSFKSITETSMTSTLGDLSLTSGGQISIGYNLCYNMEDHPSSILEEISCYSYEDCNSQDNINLKTATAIMNLPISSPPAEAFSYFIEAIESYNT